MIYTKLSSLNNDTDFASLILQLPNLSEYVKANLADRSFVMMTEAIMECCFFTDTLFVAPTLNNENEHVLGVYLWEDDQITYTGMYLYEVRESFNNDTILWICFEQPKVG